MMEFKWVIDSELEGQKSKLCEQPHKNGLVRTGGKAIMGFVISSQWLNGKI